MSTVPNRAKPIFALQKNVDVTQGGTNPKKAYDLALYEQLGKPDRAVLEVTIILVFDFMDYEGTWVDAEKKKFMADFKRECEAAWSEKFDLTTKNPTPPAQVASVIFEIQPQDGGFIGTNFGHGHWNVKCRKALQDRPSDTVPGGGGCCSNGNANWDSLDLTPGRPFGAPAGHKQRGAIHEFGHMLGYRDEYKPTKPPKNADEANLYSSAHLSDVDSILYWGEKVYPRHYVFFADWISFKWIGKDSKNCKGHDWKVDGTTDTLNAGLS